MTQVLEAAIAASANPWPLRRERALELTARYPHAAEMLQLYQGLNPLQEAAFQQARAAGLRLEDLPAFAVERVLPAVVDVTVAKGPAPLRDGVIAVFCSADLVNLVQRWLDQQAMTPFETYMSRASASPLLEALTPSPSASNQPSPSPLVDEGQGVGPVRQCPACGGLPQLSYFAISGEQLVSGPRYLVCSRCSHAWVFSRMTCAVCGESNGARLPIYQEEDRFPHARIDGCRSCGRYLLTFDLRRDNGTVPLVDELACLPLDLYARDQGLTKITPNLMGS